VRFGETDMQNVVYYANYLLYAEVGRVAYLRELGETRDAKWQHYLDRLAKLGIPYPTPVPARR